MDADDEMRTFGNRLRLLRIRKGLSQTMMGELLGSDKQSVSNWERGRNYPTIKKLRDICTTLHVTPNFLLDLDIKAVRQDKDKDLDEAVA